jgi:hypothetical protein
MKCSSTDVCAVEHPHGGGRGKSKGNRHPSSPWGKPVSFPTLYSDPSRHRQHAHPIRRPNLVTRHGESTMSTNGWLLHAFATWASAGTRNPRKRAREAPLELLTYRVHYCRSLWGRQGISLWLRSSLAIYKHATGACETDHVQNRTQGLVDQLTFFSR